MYFSGNAAALCSDKLVGKPNQTEQYPYASDPQFFYACVRNAEDSASSNVGCLQCPQSRIFSATCKQCLLSLDGMSSHYFRGQKLKAMNYFHKKLHVDAQLDSKYASVFLEACLGPYQTSMMEFFLKISSWQASGYSTTCFGA